MVLGLTWQHPDAENRGFYRLSDGRLDGKSATEYEDDLSRGDLSRPACSHVKQVAKQAGDTCDPGLWNFSRPVFCDHFPVVTMEVTCLRLRRQPPATVPKPVWSIPEPCARSSARHPRRCS